MTVTRKRKAEKWGVGGQELKTMAKNYSVGGEDGLWRGEKNKVSAKRVFCLTNVILGCWNGGDIFYDQIFFWKYAILRPFCYVVEYQCVAEIAVEKGREKWQKGSPLMPKDDAFNA